MQALKNIDLNVQYDLVATVIFKISICLLGFDLKALIAMGKQHPEQLLMH